MEWEVIYHDEKLQAEVLALPPGLLARGRVFYCTLVARRIVMLHQFVKKTDKTPPRELTTARKRMKEWNDADA